MTTLLEVEKAVSELPQEELLQFAYWFGEFKTKLHIESDKKSFVDHLLSIPKDEALDLARDKNDFGRDVELWNIY